MLHKCLDWSRRARKRSTQRFRDTATREIRVLLGPRQGKLTFDDALIEQEPRIVIPGREDVLESPERVKAGEERNRQALTTGIQPQRRWPGQNADGMVAPDRREVANALWIMPHPISVDEASTAGGDHIQHAPIDMVGDARDQLLRWFAQAFGPVAAHQFMIAADTTGGDNHRLGFESELAHDHPRTRHAALDRARFQHFPVDAINHAVGHGEFGHTMPEAQRDQSALLALTHTTNKRLYHTWTRPPCDMKAGNRIAMPGRKIATTLCPLHHREEANALSMQPGILLARSKIDVGFCPAARPQVFFPVKPGAAKPVLQSQIVGITNTQPPLHRRVDQEQAPERPERLPAQ